MNHKSLAKPHI